MHDIIVASQLPDALRALFAARVPEARFGAVPYGTIADMPGGARILLATPFPDSEAALTAPQPSGWPFGLEWVHLISVGLDLYPRWLIEAPLAVTNSPAVTAVALAEFALAAMFAQAKRLPDIWMSSPHEREPTMLDMVEGSTIGIVGFGAIGEAISVRAQAMGMTVQALRRSEKPLLPGVRRVDDVGDLFATSDHLVLALPATAETRGMIDAAVLGRARRGMHLINIARGSLVDNQALVAALDSGRIGRATLDVTHPEPLPAEHPLRHHPKVSISQHIAGATLAVAHGLADAFADNFQRFAAGEPLCNRVDLTRGY